MNLRRMTGFDEPYLAINREERNVVALLYAALLHGDNVDRFLAAVAVDLPVEPDEVAVYVEYAFLRDLWAGIGPDNDLKRDAITRLLATGDVRALAGASTAQWNAHFGVRSEREIESPSNWVVGRFDETIADDADFLATCRFKWSFRVKPDLVVHTTREHALVVEAKVESGEGSYPATAQEKKIFNRRGLPRVPQTELQQHMMRELLGVEARHVYLTLRGRRNGLSWSEAFGALDLTGLPTWPDLECTARRAVRWRSGRSTGGPRPQRSSRGGRGRVESERPQLTATPDRADGVDVRRAPTSAAPRHPRSSTPTCRSTSPHRTGTRRRSRGRRTTAS